MARVVGQVDESKTAAILDAASALFAEKGALTDADLAALGVSLDEVKALTAALKTSRAQKPGKADTRVVRDSPFAVLSALTAAPAPARPKRKRPRRDRAPG